jgi:hypothetical protein
VDVVLAKHIARVRVGVVVLEEAFFLNAVDAPLDARPVVRELERPNEALAQAPGLDDLVDRHDLRDGFRCEQRAPHGAARSTDDHGGARDIREVLSGIALGEARSTDDHGGARDG